jgi:hypothetical protein
MTVSRSLPSPALHGADTEAEPAAAFTPGPWSHHADIACKCGTIGSEDHPIAKVYSGDWGDDFPTIQIEGGSLERRAVAVMEQITYGHINQSVADANARLIAAGPDVLNALQETWRVLRAAGTLNLSNGVQLGKTAWYIKINDAEALSDAAIAKATGAAA